jgi:hypothetical protein
MWEIREGRKELEGGGGTEEGPRRDREEGRWKDLEGCWRMKRQDGARERREDGAREEEGPRREREGMLEGCWKEKQEEILMRRAGDRGQGTGDRDRGQGTGDRINFFLKETPFFFKQRVTECW